MRIPCLTATLLFTAVTCIAAQDFDLARFRSCTRLAEQASCTENTDSLRKSLAAAVSCNSPTDAFLIANACARDSESGLYCGAAHAYSRDIGAAAFICTAGDGNCTSECRNILTALRDTLGCCINAIVNNTDSFYSFALPAFTYGVWSGCGVDPPNSTCSGALDFTLPGSRQPTCTESAQDIWCSQSSLDDTADFINAQPTCDSILQYQMEACSQRDNDYCLDTVESDISAFATPIQTACAPFQACPSACKDLLQRFVNERGCCVNTIFNSTYAVVTGLSFTAPVLANSTVFQLCEVEPPPLTCGSLPFRVPSFTMLIPLIVATVFGRKMM